MAKVRPPVTDWMRAPLDDLTARKATSRLGLCASRHPVATVMAETVQVPYGRVPSWYLGTYAMLVA